METSETGPYSVIETENAIFPEISIILPAFNEADRIGSSLEKICNFLLSTHIQSEIIVVDDGSTDGTGEIVSSFMSKGVRLISNNKNEGKGYSVRNGFIESKGEWVLFTDSDLSTPIEELHRLLEVATEGADMVIGSRALDRRKILVHQPWPRVLGGILYNWFVQSILQLPIKDSQCGFKLIHREHLKPVFEEQTICRFGFDAELLFLAQRKGLKIIEIPVIWSHDEGSKVRFLSDGLRMFVDLFKIRWNWLIGKYH